MSWQAYIDTSLIGTGFIDSAAIFSLNGKDEWARSSNFKITPDEMNAIVGAYKSNKAVLEHGFKIDGVKYMAIGTPESPDNPSSANPDCLIGKKGKEGFVIAQSKQALILAHHGETVMTPECVVVVEKLGTYLKSVGY